MRQQQILVFLVGTSVGLIPFILSVLNMYPPVVHTLNYMNPEESASTTQILDLNQRKNEDLQSIDR